MLKNKLLDNNKFVLFASFCIAVFIWGYVIVYQSNLDTVVIRDVPVSTAYVQGEYQNLGLDVISTSIETVNVTVSGVRSVVGDVDADDIVVYPVLASVTGPGEYKVSLSADSISSFKDITIDSLSIEEMTIYFDKVVTKEFTLVVDASKVSIAPNYLSGVIYTNTQELVITGPENEIQKINEVVVLANTAENLTQTTSIDADIILFDIYENEISSDVLTFSTNDIKVTVPVLKEMQLPVKIEYTNVPQGFNTNTLKLTLQPSELSVGVPSADADEVVDYLAGYIDLKNIQLDTPYIFDINYPAEYMSLDAQTVVSATINSSNLAEKLVSVTDIRVINDTENTIEVLTEEITNVLLLGTVQGVETIEGEAVIAQIDASKLSLAQGTQTAQVEFIIPTSDEVFVKSTHTVTIRK